jgi:hypothetical protein
MAWPFLVGGAICLVNSDNERDLSLLNRNANDISWINCSVIGIWIKSEGDQGATSGSFCSLSIDYIVEGFTTVRRRK